MPEILESRDSEPATVGRLPFPLVRKSHILHCSYHHWHPRYRHVTPKARVISLTKPFLDYLRADGIILPSEIDETRPEWSDQDSGVFSVSEEHDEDDDDDDEDVAAEWRDIHQSIIDTIAELGGAVMPKLNWSAPKDATWMTANTMECRGPDDVYLLLKSSDFITHDLEHPFDDCIDMPNQPLNINDIPYCLVLRKSVPKFNQALEFRCFVRERKLLCICQRDLNHFEFLFDVQGRLRSLINDFFEVHLRDTFPDENFVFDVYVPPRYDRVWLVDFNPWAPRTDPLLFSWMELLDMPAPLVPLLSDSESDEYDEILADKSLGDAAERESHQQSSADLGRQRQRDEKADEEIRFPELRLVRKGDPEAFSFNTPQYSAHKLPRDVVVASQSGEGLREFAKNWEDFLAQRQNEDDAADSSDEE